jgi:hypothetical protein
MKTKIQLLAVLCLYLSFISKAQQQCGQAEVMQKLFENHPEWRLKFEQAQAQFAEQENHQSMKGASVSQTLVPTHTVPVVFHILHLGGPENISDAQVLNQMAILNRDYQKQNADTNQVIPSYTNNIANVRFEFRLAQIDPNGNCTNGIIRHYDSITNSWPLPTNNFSAYQYTWPPNKYLNVYVVGNILGMDGAYTILPGTPIPTVADAIVIEHYVTGSIGTANVANSRVLTHEVGHWFNLQHIWGTSNQPGVACGDDLVTDTPITKGYTVCITPAAAAVCNPPIIENYQNYMDYTPCKLMFTNGQAARMLTCINGTVNSRNNLSSPANLLATGITTTAPGCLPMVGLSAPATKIVCVGNTLIIPSFTYNANATSYSWTANNGASISNPLAANASITFNSPGNSTVVCTVSNSTGIGSASMIVTALSNVAQQTTPMSESFENNALPVNWTILNPNTFNAKWNFGNMAAASGTQCLYVNTENTPNGSVEILETPSMDFLNNPGATFTYKYAYARQSNTHGDVYKLQASKDCGGSWIDIYTPNMSSFAAGSGGVSTTLFVPTASQWKTHAATGNLNLYNLLSEPNVRLRFYFMEDPAAGFGNRIYLDDINFSIPTGINELSRALQLQVYPNPTSENLSLQLQLSDAKSIRWTMHQINGTEVLGSEEQVFPIGKTEIPVSGVEKLSAGVYFLTVYVDGVKLVRKVVKD